MAIEVHAEKVSRDWRAQFELHGVKYQVMARKLADLPRIVGEMCASQGHARSEISITTAYSDAKKGVDAAVSEAEAAAKAAYEIRRSVIRKMRADGLSQEDIAHILGISHQRVSQLSR